MSTGRSQRNGKPRRKQSQVLTQWTKTQACNKLLLETTTDKATERVNAARVSSSKVYKMCPINDSSADDEVESVRT